MKPKLHRALFFALLMAIGLCSEITAVEYEPLDTTRVREVTPVRKTVGEKIADIPGEILKLPIYIAQYIGGTVSTAPIVGKFFSLLSFGGEKKIVTPFGGYGSRPGLKVGFALQKTDIFSQGDRFQYKWYYSTHDYQRYQLKYESDYALPHRLGFRLLSKYSKRPRQRFYGIGLGSLEEKEANVTLENSEIIGTGSYRLNSNSTVSLNVGFQSANLFDGKDDDLEGNIETILADPSYRVTRGQLQGSRYIKFGTAFERDSRNNLGQPSSGYHLLASLDRFVGVGRSNARDFTRYGVDFQAYHDLWRKRILAFRAKFQRIVTDEVTGGTIPVYQMSSLGGLDALRGYNRGRFVDNDLITVTLEYRYPIYHLFDAFVFVDAGRVYADLTKAEVFENWKQSFGGGLRIWKSKGTVAVVQIARSDEDTRLYFELGASW